MLSAPRRLAVAILFAAFGVAGSAVTPGVAAGVAPRQKPAQEQARERGSVARTPAEVVAGATDGEWRTLDPDRTVYFELPGGRFVLELAPWAAPLHVRNLQAMVRAGYFDGGAVVRSQDNYVAQFAARPLPEGGLEDIADALPAEREIAFEGLPFIPLPDPDTYSAAVGFTRGFPVGRDPESGTTWLAHCYGVVAVARGNSPDSGNASSLAAVSGHSPRHLDRNSSMVGRIVFGMEQLTTLPRGTGPLGFYEAAEETVPILSARMGSDLPAGERLRMQVLRTDSQSFRDYVRAYRSRVEEWFVHRADRVELCNVRVPTRMTEAPDAMTPAAAAARAIRARRAAFNDAIAAHDAGAALTFLDSDYQITTGAGEVSQGRFGEAETWEAIFARADDIVYVRTPDRVDVASPAVRAYEGGVWRGSWTTPRGRQELGGRYTAHWRLVDGRWLIRSEIFVTLSCKGPDC